MAAFPAETNFSTTMAEGHCILKIGGTQPGRVISVGEIDHEDKYEAYSLFSTASIEQVVGYIKRAIGQGNFAVVVDSMADIATFTGLGLAVTLEQLYPNSASAAVGWIFSATTCLVTAKTSITPRGGPSTMTYMIKPYSATGAAPWTITENQAYS
jgi:hypothetical protein